MQLRLERRLLGMAMLLSFMACDLGSQPAVATPSARIYGEDDRKELYELDDVDLRDQLADSVVALVPKTALTSRAALADGPTLGELANLCSDEPFSQQPAAALCTGVLLDSDLILTAGHCVRVLALDQMVAVFGYHYRAPGELALAPEAVYELSEIVAERLDHAGAAPRLDYAWIRLIHDVEPPLRPLAVARGLAEPDQPLVVAATSDGLPLKIDQAATVREASSPALDFFVANSDTSHGGSGGIALDARYAVLGILARGGEDAVATDRGCSESLHQPADADAQEEFTYAARALEGLCDQASADSSLCRADCGDPCRALPRPRAAGGCSVAPTPGSGDAYRLLVLACFIALYARRCRPTARG